MSVLLGPPFPSNKHLVTDPNGRSRPVLASLEYKKRTPLTWAVSQSLLDIASLLIKKGSDVNERDFSNDMALSLAMQGGNTRIIKLLVQHGAFVEKFNIPREVVLVGTTLHEPMIKLITELESEKEIGGTSTEIPFAP